MHMFQVCFANNPISGVLILIGLGLADYTIAIGGILGPLVAVATGLVINQIFHSIVHEYVLYARLDISQFERPLKFRKFGRVSTPKNIFFFKYLVGI